MYERWSYVCRYGGIILREGKIMVSVDGTGTPFVVIVYFGSPTVRLEFKSLTGANGP